MDRKLFALGLVVCLTWGGTVSRGESRLSPKAAAAKVDRMLEKALESQGVQPLGLVNDEDFLRRVYLDLAGTIPSAKEVTLFGLDPTPEKRSVVIDRLVSSSEFAQNWGGYLREVIFSRATEARARLAQQGFEDWLVEQLEANRGWDEITTAMITATGELNENPPTAFIFAHTGQPEELAAETARIFLGIQMQCANCHDHPYDSWTREQFHHLAAYFPRIQVRQNFQVRPPEFTVVSADFLERQEMARRDISPEQVFQLLDRNRDGELSASEARQRGRLGRRFDFILERFDADKNNKLSLKEFKTAQDEKNQQQRPGRGSAEHYMPDLNDPSSKGTRMAPSFFLGGSHLRVGADDLERRKELARAITSPRNEWFAKAFVNRLWAELLGEGFYNPLDDIGPERSCDYEEVLELLADQFVAADYDIAWLFRTITRTKAYQRALGQRQPGDPSPAFAAAVPVRLRSDQIYNAVQKALGIEGIGRLAARRLGMMGNMRRGGSRDPGRTAFFQLFNFDPSTPKDEILGNVPQALFMMNSPLLQGLINANGPTVLAQLLRDYPDDRDALSELYLRVLSREPSQSELAICREHLAAAQNRQAAYEDILWSLLNSSEFLTKR